MARFQFRDCTKLTSSWDCSWVDCGPFGAWCYQRRAARVVGGRLKKSASFVSLAQMYKQLNAPFGAFAMATLRSSSKALASNDANDITDNSIEGQIQSLTTQRDTFVAQMIGLLTGAEFKGQSFRDAQAQSLIAQGQALLNQANGLPH